MSANVIPKLQLRAALMALVWLFVGRSSMWSASACAQFEDLGTCTQNLNGKQATLDLSSSIFVTLGISYSF
jgi:hypothetical protein